jgi:hypothetical protein
MHIPMMMNKYLWILRIRIDQICNMYTYIYILYKYKVCNFQKSKQASRCCLTANEKWKNQLFVQ